MEPDDEAMRAEDARVFNDLDASLPPEMAAAMKQQYSTLAPQEKLRFLTELRSIVAAPAPAPALSPAPARGPVFRQATGTAGSGADSAAAAGPRAAGAQRRGSGDVSAEVPHAVAPPRVRAARPTRGLCCCSGSGYQRTCDNL